MSLRKIFTVGFFSPKKKEKTFPVINTTVILIKRKKQIEKMSFSFEENDDALSK